MTFIVNNLHPVTSTIPCKLHQLINQKGLVSRGQVPSHVSPRVSD